MLFETEFVAASCVSGSHEDTVGVNKGAAKGFQRQHRQGATEPLPVSWNSRLAAAAWMDEELFLFFFFY